MSGPIREVFQEVMRGSGRQGWLIGHLDCAGRALEVVLQDARENLIRNPRHALTAEAVDEIQKALKIVDALAKRLEKITAGENA